MSESTVVREDTVHDLRMNWGRNELLRAFNLDSARLSVYGVIPEMVPPAPSGGHVHVIAFDESTHRLPFWPSGRPDWTLNQTIAVIVSTEKRPHVPFSDFVDAVISRNGLSSTFSITASAPHTAPHGPPRAVEEVPSVAYQAAMQMLMKAPGLYRRAHPTPPPGSLGQGSNGIDKLKFTLHNTFSRLRSVDEAEDGGTGPSFSETLQLVVDRLDAHTQVAAWSRGNVEQLFQREQRNIRRLNMHRGMIIVLGITLICMFHGITSIMPDREKRAKKKKKSTTEKSTTEISESAPPRKRSKAHSLDKATRMYALAFYCFSECVLFATGGMYELRSGFDLPAVQEASEWRRQHLSGIVPEGEDELPHGLLEIECILRAAARYLVLHSCAMDWKHFQPVFDSTVACVMERCLDVVRKFDALQMPVIGSKRKRSFMSYQFTASWKRRRSESQSGETTFVDDHDHSDASDDDRNDDLLLEGVHVDQEYHFQEPDLEEEIREDAQQELLGQAGSSDLAAGGDALQSVDAHESRAVGAYSDQATLDVATILAQLAGSSNNSYGFPSSHGPHDSHFGAQNRGVHNLGAQALDPQTLHAQSLDPQMFDLQNSAVQNFGAQTLGVPTESQTLINGEPSRLFSNSTASYLPDIALQDVEQQRQALCLVSPLSLVSDDVHSQLHVAPAQHIRTLQQDVICLSVWCQYPQQEVLEILASIRPYDISEHEAVLREVLSQAVALGIPHGPPGGDSGRTDVVASEVDSGPDVDASSSTPPVHPHSPSQSPCSPSPPSPFPLSGDDEDDLLESGGHPSPASSTSEGQTAWSPPTAPSIPSSTSALDSQHSDLGPQSYSQEDVVPGGGTLQTSEDAPNPAPVLPPSASQDAVPVNLPVPAQLDPAQAAFDPSQPDPRSSLLQSLRPRPKEVPHPQPIPPPKPRSGRTSAASRNARQRGSKLRDKKIGRRRRRKSSSDEEDSCEDQSDQENESTGNAADVDQDYDFEDGNSTQDADYAPPKGKITYLDEPVYKEAAWTACSSTWGEMQELPRNWSLGRTPSLVPLFQGEDDVLVYGSDAKEAVIKLSLADTKLLRDEQPSHVDQVLFIHPSSDPFETPRSPQEATEMKRVHGLITDNISRTIVIRAARDRNLSESAEERLLGSDDIDEFESQLFNVYGDPDTLVDTQVCDANLEHAHEPAVLDLDSPDSELFDVQACIRRLRELPEDSVTEIEQDSEDGMGTIFTMSLRQFAHNLRHLRTAGCNVISGVQTTPCRRMEVLRRLTCDFAKAANVTAKFNLAPIDQSEVNFTLFTGRGAYTAPHIDANGFHTGVHIVLGEKLWIIREPLVTPMTEDFRKMKDREFRISAIRLRKGDTLLMPPGTIHEVLTTRNSVATGGHFIAQPTLADTLVWSMRTAVTYWNATNATHNGVLLSIFDVSVMRRLQPVYYELRWFQEHAELSDTAAQTLEANADLTTPDFTLWIVGILFSDEIFPRSEDRQGMNAIHEKKHHLVRDYVVYFVRWVDAIWPSYQIFHRISAATCAVFADAQRECTPPVKYDSNYIRVQLCALFKVTIVMPVEAV